MAKGITPADERYFGMFSDDGNVAVHRVVSDLGAVVASGEVGDRDAFDERLDAAMSDIDELGHREVFDTDVREHIAAALRPVLERAGIDAEDITAI